MRKVIKSDEEIREVAIRLKAERGRLTVADLTGAVPGANVRLRRIVQELNGDVPMPPRVPEAVGASEDTAPADLPPAVRTELSRLEEVFRTQLQQCAAEADARARATEQVLRSAHEAEAAGLRSDREMLERYLDDMDAALAGTAEQREAAQEALDESERHLEEVEGLLTQERADHAATRARLEEDVRTALEAERRSADSRHEAQVAAAAATAELATLKAALAEEREAHQRLADRCSSVQANRDVLIHQAQSAQEQVAEVRRELDAERSTARHLQQVLTDLIGDPTTSPRRRSRRKSLKPLDPGHAKP